jgi:HEAT repeat protein
MTGETPTNIEKLIRRLAHPDTVIQVHAGMLLGSMGPGARAAVPALLELLKGPAVLGRKLAAMTLGSIGAAEAVPALREAVQDPDSAVRRLAAAALEKVDAPANRATAA